MTELASRGLIDGRQLGDEDGVSTASSLTRLLAPYSGFFPFDITSICQRASRHRQRTASPCCA